MKPFRQYDWKKDYLHDMLEAPTWFLDDYRDLTDQLPDVETPTLLLFGGSDPIAPVAVGRFLESRLPRVRLAVIEGCEHRMTGTTPDVVADHIRELLKS